MTVNQAILQAATPIVPACEANVYQGEETTYCTFNHTEMPDHFGDDQPEFIVYLVQLHFHCPLNTNPTATKKALKQALLEGDFTYPTVTDGTDLDGHHFVFEFAYVDGDV